MVSKKSHSMRLKTQSTATVTPSLSKAPKSKAPTRLKSGRGDDVARHTAVPGTKPTSCPMA